MIQSQIHLPMLNDFTFAIIKPNAIRTGKAGPVLAMITESGFRICALKMVRLSLQQAEDFYAVHKGRPFYPGLIDFMTSGPVIVTILSHQDAVEEFRKLIGNTDPLQAREGTIRKLYGVNTQMNAVHGSDSHENAVREADFFFSPDERF
ncbi:MAG: nucleoside-diphosphate kinase [Bacteroidales bacterium]|nr:nucleoside-diphosphate kinase [Bacteroidales bacterium]